MNSSKTLVLALALASAATLAAASNDFPDRGGPTSDANSVDGTGTFSVNPRFPGNPGEAVGPDPAEMTAETSPTSGWKPVAEPMTRANRYAWSVDEVYLPTPQPQAAAGTFPERAPGER